MAIELIQTSDTDYLLPDLRIHIGDTEEPYTYTDDMLKYCLLAGMKMLIPRWNGRYSVSYNSITENFDVARTSAAVFMYIAPPVIQYGDERAVVLAASIALKSGLIYTVGGSAVSWRDDEVSFSNLSGAQLQEASLTRDMAELDRLLPDRRHRLAKAVKGELPGFKFPPNFYEG